MPKFEDRLDDFMDAIAGEDDSDTSDADEIEEDEEINEDDEEELESDSDDEESEESDEESDEDDEESEDEDEESEDKDEDEDFTEADLTKLSAFPKAVRKDIARMPKESQAQLISWLKTQNEDKRKLKAESAQIADESKREYEAATEVRKGMIERMKAISEAFEKNGKKAFTAEDRALIEKMLKQDATVVSNAISDFHKATLDRLALEAGPTVESILRDMGKKPEVFFKKDPIRATLLLTPLMFASAEDRPKVKAILRKVARMLAEPSATSRSKPARRASKGGAGKDIMRDLWKDTVTKSLKGE